MAYNYRKDPYKPKRVPPAEVVTGTVLAISEKAVQIKTTIGNVWLPLSRIVATIPEAYEVHSEVKFKIPYWLYKNKGFIGR
jgi:hypothetical protein